MKTLEWTNTHSKALGEILDEGEHGILAVSAEWCVPCKNMKKHLSEELYAAAAEILDGKDLEKLRLVVINGEDEKNAGMVQKLEIDCFPTWFIFKREGNEMLLMKKNEGWSKRSVKTTATELGKRTGSKHISHRITFPWTQDR